MPSSPMAWRLVSRSIPHSGVDHRSGIWGGLASRRLDGDDSEAGRSSGSAGIPLRPTQAVLPPWEMAALGCGARARSLARRFIRAAAPMTDEFTIAALAT